MPTASEQARTESRDWMRLAGRWTEDEAGEAWGERPPTEQAVTIFFDPSEDISRRAGAWNHEVAGNDLPSLALFAAGLGEAEADAWDRGLADVATRAYESRRFLLGDRILHWAVPWLVAVGEAHPVLHDPASTDCEFLLDLGDQARVAPALPGREGLQIEGEDSYGPVAPVSDLETWLTSLWSGAVLLGRRPTVELFQEAEQRWLGLAEARPGSAQLWLDLAERAGRTASLLG